MPSRPRPELKRKIIDKVIKKYGEVLYNPYLFVTLQNSINERGQVNELFIDMMDRLKSGKADLTDIKQEIERRPDDAFYDSGMYNTPEGRRVVDLNRKELMDYILSRLKLKPREKYLKKLSDLNEIFKREADPWPDVTPDDIMRKWFVDYGYLVKKFGFNNVDSLIRSADEIGLEPRDVFLGPYTHFSSAIKDGDELNRLKDKIITFSNAIKENGITIMDNLFEHIGPEKDYIKYGPEVFIDLLTEAAKKGITPKELLESHRVLAPAFAHLIKDKEDVRELGKQIFKIVNACSEHNVDRGRVINSVAGLGDQVTNRESIGRIGTKIAKELRRERELKR